jgi:hypothetical protein
VEDQLNVHPEQAGRGDDVRDLSLDEAIALYHGEWVLMKITAFDQHRSPARGIVLAHSSSRDRISDALCNEPSRAGWSPETPRQPYYTFKAFPRAHVGESYEQAQRRFQAQVAQVHAARRAAQRP